MPIVISRTNQVDFGEPRSGKKPVSNLLRVRIQSLKGQIMAYPHAIYKLTWGGSIFQGKDIWSNGIHLGLAVDVDVPEFDAESVTFLATVADLLADYISNGALTISSAVSLEWVKLARIGTDGLYTEDPLLFDFNTPVTGTLSSNQVPQQSVVVSLRTNERRGLAKSGRIYLPVSGLAGADGTMNLQTVQGIADASAELFSDINALNITSAGTAAVVVASNVREGATNTVYEVRVGNVIDTQRSRRNAFVETYESAELTVF